MSDSLLLEQYRIAVDLYKHEDLLNWKKFHNLVYVNTALVGMLGLWDLKCKNIPTMLAVFISVLGVSISICFMISIKSGVKYLNARKNSLVAIDLKIKESTGQVAIRMDEPQLIKAPTTRVLIILPVLLCFFWVIFLLTVILFG